MMRRIAIVIALLACSRGAAAEDERLTGVSADVTRYRVGTKTVCDLAEPNACVTMSAKKQKKLKLRAPKKTKKPKLEAKLADGRTVQVRIASRGDFRCGGITGKDDPPVDCDQMKDTMELVSLLSPSIEVVVRDAAGNEIQLAVDQNDQVLRDSPSKHMPGTIFHVVWSKDATRVVVAYQSSEMVVVGWDLASRL
jgi:hypothetical protein